LQCTSSPPSLRLPFQPLVLLEGGQEGDSLGTLFSICNWFFVVVYFLIEKYTEGFPGPDIKKIL